MRYTRSRLLIFPDIGQVVSDLEFGPAARSCREYFFVTYSGKAYSVDPGEKCNRYKRILASSVPKLPQLPPVIVRWSTLFRPRFAA